MPTETQVTAEEYRRMSFEGPDAEFVHGEIVERTLPNLIHSRVQAQLVVVFAQGTGSPRVFPCPELRVQLGPDLFRVVDLAVFAGKLPKELIPTQPQLVAIEIVSPDDRHTEVLEKLEEYRRWGVANVWLVDPWLKKLHTYTETGLIQVSEFTLHEYSLRITTAHLLEGV